MPTSPRASCAASTGGTAPGPRSSSMEMSSERGPYRTETRARPPPACFSEFVSALLDDPVGRQLEGRIERSAAALDRQLHGHSGTRGPARAGLPTGRGRAAAPGCHPVAEDAQHASHVGQGDATGRVDRLERAARLLRPPVEGAQGAAGLDHDHADVVGHRIMQLAGDPLPLLQDRPPVALGALELRSRACSSRAPV